MKRITIALNEVEEKLFKELEDKLGYKPTFVLRQGFREFYERVMPKKSKDYGKDQLTLTAEKWCKSKGGKLITNDSGQKVCCIHEGGLQTELEIPENIV